LEIRDLMYLEASAAAGNFTHAAKTLGINASMWQGSKWATIELRCSRAQGWADYLERWSAGATVVPIRRDVA
jgi:hypothetical protein